MFKVQGSRFQAGGRPPRQSGGDSSRGSAGLLPAGSLWIMENGSAGGTPAPRGAKGWLWVARAEPRLATANWQGEDRRDHWSRLWRARPPLAECPSPWPAHKGRGRTGATTGRGYVWHKNCIICTHSSATARMGRSRCACATFCGAISIRRCADIDVLDLWLQARYTLECTTWLRHVQSVCAARRAAYETYTRSAE
jgi:hypothetical protein